MTKNFKVGEILVNSLGEYTKVITAGDDVYGISGWTPLKVAQKAKVAETTINIYGLEATGAKSYRGTAPKAETAPKAPAPKAPVKASAPKASTQAPAKGKGKGK